MLSLVYKDLKGIWTRWFDETVLCVTAFLGEKLSHTTFQKSSP